MQKQHFTRYERAVRGSWVVFVLENNTIIEAVEVSTERAAEAVKNNLDGFYDSKYEVLISPP